MAFTDTLSDVGDGPEEYRVTCTDISVDRLVTVRVEDLEHLILSHRPDWSKIRWIHVQGSLPDPFLEPWRQSITFTLWR